MPTEPSQHLQDKYYIMPANILILLLGRPLSLDHQAAKLAYSQIMHSFGELYSHSYQEKDHLQLEHTTNPYFLLWLT